MTALSADSGTSKLQLLMDGEVVVSEWEGTPGSTKLQEVPGVEGVEGSVLVIQGIMEPGDYLAISEVTLGGGLSLKTKSFEYVFSALLFACCE